ncbi:MAG: sigma-70 family RNA polymerase sigma factor [Deltaproteobacteria bacterium]|nr:sigma-70 family RNA polymerase sigma factor [Deltaproteobacteria bacterium]
MVTPLAAELAQAREQFLSVVEEVRPALHRYCARLTGSVIEGEDIVQDTLARAFYALSQSPEVPPLRPWLFKIAHNCAIDFLRGHGRRHTEVRADLDDVAGYSEAPDPGVVRAALTQFLALPLTQRSAVILKDVLGHSLEETAETMATTIMAVKAALVRGRASLRALQDDEAPRASDAETRLTLDRYAALFNSRDWDGVRGLIADDCRLDLVAKSQRRGKAVGMYFGRYEKEPVTLRVVRLEGQLALAAYVGGAAEAAYFVLLEVAGDKVQAIRDYRYVKYIASEAAFELL